MRMPAPARAATFAWEFATHIETHTLQTYDVGSVAHLDVLRAFCLLSKPCVDNQAIFVYPQAFSEFLLKASRDLGSPISPGLSWREYNQ